MLITLFFKVFTEYAQTNAYNNPYLFPGRRNVTQIDKAPKNVSEQRSLATCLGLYQLVQLIFKALMNWSPPVFYRVMPIRWWKTKRRNISSIVQTTRIDKTCKVLTPFTYLEELPWCRGLAPILTMIWLCDGYNTSLVSGCRMQSWREGQSG